MADTYPKMAVNGDEHLCEWYKKVEDNMGVIFARNTSLENEMSTEAAARENGVQEVKDLLEAEVTARENGVQEVKDLLWNVPGRFEHKGTVALSAAGTNTGYTVEELEECTAAFDELRSSLEQMASTAAYWYYVTLDNKICGILIDEKISGWPEAADDTEFLEGASELHFVSARNWHTPIRWQRLILFPYCYENYRQMFYRIYTQYNPHTVGGVNENTYQWLDWNVMSSADVRDAVTTAKNLINDEKKRATQYTDEQLSEKYTELREMIDTLAIDTWDSTGLLEHKGTLDFTEYIDYFEWNVENLQILSEASLDNLDNPINDRVKYIYWVKLSGSIYARGYDVLGLLIDDGNSGICSETTDTKRTQTIYGMNGECYTRDFVSEYIPPDYNKEEYWTGWEDISLATKSYADTKANQMLNESKSYTDTKAVEERAVSDTRYFPKDIAQGKVPQTKLALEGLAESYQIYGNSVQEPHSISESITAEGVADWSFSIPYKTVLENLRLTLSAVTITQTVSEMGASVSVDIQNDSLTEISLTAMCYGGVGHYTIQNADGEIVASGEELTEISITSIPDGTTSIYFQTDAEGARWAVTGTINYQNEVQCTLSAAYEDGTSPGIPITCSAGDVLTDELLAKNGYTTSNIVSISIHNENNTEFLLDGTVKYKVSTPAPETPIEVKSVGNLVSDGEYAGKYKVENIITGKNLLTNLYGSETVKSGVGEDTKGYDVSDNQVTIYGITYTLNPDGTILANGTATADSGILIPCVKGIKADEYHFLSGCPNDGSRDTYMLLGYTSAGGSFYEYGSGVITYRPDALNYSSVRLRIKQGITVDNLLFKPQVETGAVGTDYETPRSKRLAVYLDEPLRKIGNYTDYIDWKNQKVVRNVDCTVLSGTEDWMTVGTMNCVYYTLGLAPSYVSRTLTGNRFAGTSGSNLEIHGTCQNSDRLYFCNTDTSTLAEFKAKLQEWHQSGKPLTVCAALKTPVEEDISLPSMELYGGTNDVYTTTSVQPSNMVLEYNQNPTDVINDLRQAIVALQSATE